MSKDVWLTFDIANCFIKGMKKMTDKYKPFDLKRALSGDKFVRADGAVPSEWHWFKHLENDNEKLAVLIGGDIHWYDEKGINCRCGNQCNDKLVMMPIKKKLWVAVAKNERMNFARALKYYYMNETAFSNRSDLIENIRERGLNPDDHHLIEVEIDE